MPNDFQLTPEELSLIQERRARAAKVEAGRLEAEVLPDLLSLNTEQILNLPADKRAAIMRANLERAMRGDQ